MLKKLMKAKSLEQILHFGTLFIFTISILNCTGQVTKKDQISSTKAESNKIIGGGCDGCELMYIGMPKNISAIDTSSAWNKNGQRLLITGTVLKLDGKTPASNVIIYYWQTNNKGYYSPNAKQDERTKKHGSIRGWVKSDVNGNYSIYTIRPAPYPNRKDPAHIHLSIKEPTIDDEYYTDALIFDDDKLLSSSYIKSRKNRGGSGILRPLIGKEMQIAEHNIILGLHIPNYPNSKTNELKSGLNIGEDSPSFAPFHAWGPDKGTKACPVCKYGRYHGVLFFVGNSENWNEVKQWLLFFEKESIKRERFLKVYFIYSNKKNHHKSQQVKELEQIGNELKLTKLALTFVPSFNDPISRVNLNNFNPEAENTIIIYRNRNIIDKFINLKPTEINKKEIITTLNKTRSDYFELARPKFN